MNKKQNLLAISLSASFVLAGANVAEANDQVSAPVQTEDVNLPIAEQKDQISVAEGENGSSPTSEETTNKSKDNPTTEAENTELDNKKVKRKKLLPLIKVMQKLIYQIKTLDPLQ